MANVIHIDNLADAIEAQILQTVAGLRAAISNGCLNVQIVNGKIDFDILVAHNRLDIAQTDLTPQVAVVRTDAPYSQVEVTNGTETQTQSGNQNTSQVRGTTANEWTEYSFADNLSEGAF